jgi:hypothetical protein
MWRDPFGYLSVAFSFHMPHDIRIHYNIDQCIGIMHGSMGMGLNLVHAVLATRKAAIWVKKKFISREGL